MFLKEAKEIKEQIIQWRHDIHKIAEVGMETFETAKYVSNELTKSAREIAEYTAAKTGENADDLYEKFADAINTKIDFNYDRTITGPKVLKKLLIEHLRTMSLK